MDEWSGLSEGGRTSVEGEISMAAIRNFYAENYERLARGLKRDQKWLGAG